MGLTRRQAAGGWYGRERAIVELQRPHSQWLAVSWDSFLSWWTHPWGSIFPQWEKGMWLCLWNLIPFWLTFHILIQIAKIIDGVVAKNSHVCDSPSSIYSTWNFSYHISFSSFYIQVNLKNCDCLASQCVMVNHFSKIILAFCYWFWHFGMTLHGWWVSFPHSSAVAKLS